MIDQQDWSLKRAAGLVLVLGFVANVAGVTMFWIRGGQSGGQPPIPTYLVWERGFIAAAVVITSIGFVLLQNVLENTRGRALAIVGATAYLFVGVLVVTAETLSLALGERQVSGFVVIYVVGAFLAQAVIGGALLQSKVAPVWVGWVVILWNISWLALLPVISPRDIYFPVLHHVMPLMIGIALLRRRS
jgi:hypothetical protein